MNNFSSYKINSNLFENFFNLSPEYYLPEYQALIEKIKSKNFIKLNKICKITDGEHGSPDYDINSKCNYLTAGNIEKNKLINLTKLQKISEKQNEKNKRSKLNINDLVVYTVGAYAGNVAVVEKECLPANIPRSVAVLKFKNSNFISPGALSLFLNSKFGYFQTFRLRSGNAQPTLMIEKLKQIIIPNLQDKINEELNLLYFDAIKLRSDAGKLINESISILSKEIGIDPKHEYVGSSFTKTFNELIENNRFDSEFHNPKFDYFFDKIVNYRSGYNLLGKISSKINNNYDSKKVDRELINYIEINSVNIENGQIKINPILNKNAAISAVIELKDYDLLISKVRPNRGGICINLERINNSTKNIASSAFYVLNTSEKKDVNFLWIYLKLIKDLLSKFTTGTSYPTINASYIKNIPVPLIDEKLKNEIIINVDRINDDLNKADKILQEANNILEKSLDE